MSRRSGVSNSTVLYIGLVPYEWDENNLRSVVCGSGAVVDVRIGFDYAGKNKGFCFIEYANPQEAKNALSLLSQVKIMNHNNQAKRLRVELSKEGLRSNTNDYKQPLQLTRNYLPGNVQLPPGMQGGMPMQSPMSMQSPMGLGPGSMGPGSMGPGSMGPGPMGPGPMGPMGPINTPSPAMGRAHTNLPPQTQSLPFKAPDKISENVSKIPPPQLIEMITNLKAVLNGPNANRAAEVFQMSPYLAASAAQALLLMGFIDSDVIQDSIKNPVQPSPQQQQQQQYPQSLPQPSSLPQPPSLPNVPRPGFLPTPPMGNMTTKWPHLPMQAQAKLSAMAPDQAELIAQVLTIPPEQIGSLEPDKQMMVTNLRNQYLS